MAGEHQSSILARYKVHPHANSKNPLLKNLIIKKPTTMVQSDSSVTTLGESSPQRRATEKDAAGTTLGESSSPRRATEKDVGATSLAEDPNNTDDDCHSMNLLETQDEWSSGDENEDNPCLAIQNQIEGG